MAASRRRFRRQRDGYRKAAGGFQSLIDMPWIKERHRPAGYPERLLSLLPGLQPPYVLDSWQPVRQPRERAAIGEGLVAPRSCSLAWLGGWYKGSRADSRGNLTPASPDAGSDSRGSGASADEHPLPPTRYLEHPGYCGITLVPRFPPGQTLFFPPSFSSITSFSGLTRWVDARAISSLLFNLVILSFLLLASRCGRSISMKRGYGIILEAD